MKITRVKETRLPDSLSDISFGNVFTDHMLICTYKNGEWGEAEIIPNGTVSFPPTTMALHYGQACFEGMKAFRNEEDEVFLFRPEKNIKRMNKSAVRLAMPEIPEEVFAEGLNTLIDMERKWIPNELGKSLYVRPVLFASESMLLARIAEEYTFCIICTVANNYYSKPLKVKIAQTYSRAAPGGVGAAKAAGNYAASFYPTKLAREEGFDQLIWTDSVEHKYFEESGTMNIFVRINDTIITPPITERILDGVTRDSLVNLAKHNGWEVLEEKISYLDVYEAHKNGTLKEVFGCGTAVIVNRFVTIGYPEEILDMPEISDEDSFAFKLKQDLLNIQSGRMEDPFGWRKKVEENSIPI